MTYKETRHLAEEREYVKEAKGLHSHLKKDLHNASAWKSHRPHIPASVSCVMTYMEWPQGLQCVLECSICQLGDHLSKYFLLFNTDHFGVS